MEEKALIKTLSDLKSIKPRQEWVLSVKSDILGKAPQPRVFDNAVAPRAEFTSVFGMPVMKMAYAFGVLLFVLLGGYGFFQYSNNVKPKVVANKTSGVELAAPVKNNMEDFKLKSRNLAEVAKVHPEQVKAAVQEVKEAVKSLTDAIEKDPQVAKAVALDVNNNKTYLDVQGADDLKETSEFLYKTIDEQMIKDLENTTLAESQQETLGVIKNLYEEKKYTDALESILLLNASMNN